MFMDGIDILQLVPYLSRRTWDLNDLLAAINFRCDFRGVSHRAIVDISSGNTTTRALPIVDISSGNTTTRALPFLDLSSGKTTRRAMEGGDETLWQKSCGEIAAANKEHIAAAPASKAIRQAVARTSLSSSSRPPKPSGRPWRGPRCPSCPASSSNLAVDIY